MIETTRTLRFAVPGAIVLGLACVGFAVGASAQDASKGAGDQKPVTDVGAGNGGNNSSLRSNNVTDVTAGNGGNNSSLRSNDVKDVSAGNGGNNSSLRSNGVVDVSAGNGGNAANLRAQGVQE